MGIKLQEAIQRIIKFEMIFDEITYEFHRDPITCFDDEERLVKWNQLISYYESGLWLADYELDEAGLLPSGLKRGVLSQDALYNFMDEVKEVKNNHY